MKPRTTYHHGALREALLEAAEAILRRDGLPALSLRAIAREAGVSHGSPAHHFQDLTGLLSELAAIGYQRLGSYLKTARDRPGATRDDTDRAYVRFALDNPSLYALMFREERLDSSRHALVEARKITFGILGQVSITSGQTSSDSASLTSVSPKDALAAAAGSMAIVGAMTATWSLVHGFSVLATEGQLVGLLQLAPPGTDEMALLNAALADWSRKGPTQDPVR